MNTMKGQAKHAGGRDIGCSYDIRLTTVQFRDIVLGLHWPCGKLHVSHFWGKDTPSQHEALLTAKGQPACRWR